MLILCVDWLADQMAFEVSGGVLAGGASSRLGFDKSLIPFGGRPLIARVVETLRGVTDDCIVVTKTPKKFSGVLDGVRFVPDAYPLKAALVGIYSALLAARHEHVLVVACDMPFLNVDLLSYLMALSPGYDVVIPRRAKGVEALHAVYSVQCIQPIERLLRQGKVMIVNFFPEVRVRYVDTPELRRFDPDESSFININTPDDRAYAQALALQRD